MDYLKQVQKGIDYIEANLDVDIHSSKVAGAAGISQWHFQRIFKALSSETLKTYIRSRRLANSLDKLLGGNDKIIDIAICAGFESQESFSRAFKKSFQLTPAQYRKLGDKSLFLKKAQFSSEYLRHINTGLSLTPKIYQQEKMQLVGITTQFYSVDSEKNNIAQQLPPLWNGFLSRLDEIENIIEGVCYGVVRQAHDNTDLLQYSAVTAVSNVGKIPDGMSYVELPATTYASFTHKGLVANINDTVNYVYSNWLLQSDHKHSYGADLEVYGDRYDPDSDQSVIHYAIPIRA